MTEAIAGATSASEKTERKLAELRRSQAFATGVLLLMTTVFVLTLLYESRWPWLFYLRSFAEASMVGACADWFAVVALFRRPFGLPIPHTAIVPANKARIADTIGAFICDNFLAPGVVVSRLESVDAAGSLARWLAEDANAKAASSRLVYLIASMFSLLEREKIRSLVLDATKGSMEWISPGPLAGDALSVLLASGQLMVLAERAIAFGDSALVRHHDFIQEKVTEHSSSWIPRWIDAKLADRVLSGIHTTLNEMRQTDHPWRPWFRSTVSRLAERLKTDPEMNAQAERVKHDLLSKPEVTAYIDTFLRDLGERLQQDFAPENQVTQAGIERGLTTLGQWLGADVEVRKMINVFVRRIIEAVVVPHRDEIGAYIAQVVKEWDDDTLVAKLEITVGRDLQYVRINGTLVGGLVGLAIAAVTKLLGVMH